MRNPSTVFDEYMEARYSGENPNPREYIQRVPGKQQKELAQLIEDFEWVLKRSHFDEIIAHAGKEGVENFIKRFWSQVTKEKN